MKRDVSAIFYDIESLENVFTLAAYAPDMNEDSKSSLYIYYLHDRSAKSDFDMTTKENLQMIAQRIREKNKNFHGAVYFRNLAEPTAIQKLAAMFGVSIDACVNRTYGEARTPYRLVCDTDPDYAEQYSLGNAPFLCGYNSANYDTTMLAFYFFSVLCRKNKDKWSLGKPEPAQITASEMREFNNVLFSKKFKSDNHMSDALRYTSLSDMISVVCGSKVKPDFKSPANRIRKNMLFSGRHLDVAKLPGKQNFLALKKVLGMLGYQILESDKLNDRDAFISSIDQMADLIAYNTSDVVNLELLFYNDTYKAQFDLKKQLLSTYQEIVYEAIDPEYNKRDFTMPPEKEGEFDENHHAYEGYAPYVDPKHVRMDRLYIDSSSAQLATRVLCPYGQMKDLETVQYTYPEAHEAKRLGVESVDVLEATKKWVDENLKGDCFKQAREDFQATYDYYASLRGHNFNASDSYNQAYDVANNPRATVYSLNDVSEFKQLKSCMPYYDGKGKPTSCFVNFSIGGIHGAEYNKVLYDDDLAKYRNDPNRNRKPVLFTASTDEDGRPKMKLNPKYTFTSTDMTNHEDFQSYYPNLLRRMRAFWNNGLGYDRYGVIFNLKQEYGKLMKDKSLSAEERNKYKILREGTKLILNSASGAADAAFESNIRMNNRIIAMRIIGQLFTWRIGQSQALHGAKITSTNTDGLYSVLEEKLNNFLLEKEARSINVEIEPEPCYLISKDSNNRIEADRTENGLVITSASGGTLACRKGPNPSKSLDHPAVMDWVLSEYLVKASQHDGVDLEHEFDKDVGRELFLRALEGDCAYNKNFSKSANLLNMFQVMVASSPSTYNFKYGKNSKGELVVLQHYNRAFIMKDDINDSHCLHLRQATARILNQKTLDKRMAEQGDSVNLNSLYSNEPEAVQVLEANGITLSELFSMRSPRREASVSKINRIEPEWEMLIENHNLGELDESYAKWILENLDIDKYVSIAADTFNKTWMNRTPSREATQLTLLSELF